MADGFTATGDTCGFALFKGSLPTPRARAKPTKLIDINTPRAIPMPLSRRPRRVPRSDESRDVAEALENIRRVRRVNEASDDPEQPSNDHRGDKHPGAQGEVAHTVPSNECAVQGGTSPRRTPARLGSTAKWLGQWSLAPLPAGLAAEHTLNDGHDLLHRSGSTPRDDVTGTANSLCSIRSARDLPCRTYPCEVANPVVK